VPMRDGRAIRPRLLLPWQRHVRVLGVWDQRHGLGAAVISHVVDDTAETSSTSVPVMDGLAEDVLMEIRRQVVAGRIEWECEHRHAEDQRLVQAALGMGDRERSRSGPECAQEP
jgi:hypothetical protein